MGKYFVDQETTEPYETPFTLVNMTVSYNPMEYPDLQPHMRPLLDTLNCLNGFVHGRGVTIIMDSSQFDKNEVKLVLEFKTG